MVRWTDFIILIGFVPIIGVSVVALIMCDYNNGNPVNIWLISTSLINIFFVCLIVCIYSCFSQKLLKLCCVLFIIWLIVSDTIGAIYLSQDKIDILSIIMFVFQGLNIPFLIYVIRFASCMD